MVHAAYIEARVEQLAFSEETVAHLEQVIGRYWKVGTMEEKPCFRLENAEQWCFWLDRMR